MNKNRSICIFVLFIFTLFSSFLFAQDKPIITVLDLKTSDVSEDEMRSIISLLSSALFQTDKYTVIDVTERESILGEIKFSLSGCTDEECQIEIGKLLAAENIVVGSIGTVGTKYVMSVKLLETSTSRTVSTADGIYSDLDGVLEGIIPLAFTLAGMPVEETTETASGGTNGIDEAGSSGNGGAQPARQPASGNAVAAVSTLGAGAVAGGVGGYLLYAAIQFLQGPVEDAFQAYDNAAPGSDFDALFQTYMTEYNQYKSRFIVSVALAGGGAALLATSAILFSIPATQPEPVTILSFLVQPNVEGVSFGVSLSR